MATIKLSQIEVSEKHKRMILVFDLLANRIRTLDLMRASLDQTLELSPEGFEELKNVMRDAYALALKMKQKDEKTPIAYYKQLETEEPVLTYSDYKFKIKIK